MPASDRWVVIKFFFFVKTVCVPPVSAHFLIPLLRGCFLTDPRHCSLSMASRSVSRTLGQAETHSGVKAQLNAYLL